MVAEGGEGENPLPFQNAGGGGRGGGRGPLKKWFFVGKSGPGPKPRPKPPGDLAHRPLGPGSRHSHRLTSCVDFLLRLKPSSKP